MTPEFWSAFIATRYLLGLRGEELWLGVPPHFHRALLELDAPERGVRARALARALAPLQRGWQRP